MNLNFSTRILFTKFWYQDLNNGYLVTIAFTETAIWEGYMVIGFKSFLLHNFDKNKARRWKVQLK